MNRTLGVLLLACASLAAGCGVDSMSAAATAAALKQKEIEAGKKNMVDVQKKLAESTEKMQQNLQKSEEADK